MNRGVWKRDEGLRPGDLVLLGIAASYWPLGVLASNLVGISHLERLVGLIAILWLSAVGASWGLIRLGVERLTAVRAVFLTVAILMSGGRLLWELGALPGWIIMALVVGLSVVLIHRMENEALLSPLFVALAVALMSGPVISLYMALAGLGTSQVVDALSPEIELHETPDMYVVVLDGYPGLRTLAIEDGDDKYDLVSALGERGFQVPSSAWSSYWSTDLSVSSLLNMSYPVVEPFQGEATVQRLYDVISGDNALVETMKLNGYSTYMVESGWSGDSCGSEFDHCIPSPLLGEAMYITLVDTVIGPLIRSSLGHPFTIGTENSMEWLLENAPSIRDDESPSLVLAHLIAPHPPFYLDGTCQRVVDPSRDGSGLYEPGIPDDDREAYFAGQMACVDSFMLNLADAVGPNDVVVYVSDHGTARRRQLNIPAESWARKHVIERFNVFASVRVADACEVGDPIINPNLLRHVLSCYSDSPLDDVEARMFMPAMVEVDPQTVQGIMGRDEDENH